LAIPLESELQDSMVNDWTITDENDWLEVVYKNSALRKQTTTKEPDAAIKEVTATDTNIQLTNRFLVLEDQSCNLDEIETQRGANTNTTAEEKTSKILLIGDSIVRNIKLQTNKAKITKICCSGKKVKEVHERAMLQMEHQKDLDTVIFHAGVNDIQYKQTETLNAFSYRSERSKQCKQELGHIRPTTNEKKRL
jgi:hypothetical protein